MQTRRWALPLTLLLSLVIPGVGVTQDSEDPLVKALRASVMNSYRDSPPPITSFSRIASAARMEARWVSTP